MRRHCLQMSSTRTAGYLKGNNSPTRAQFSIPVQHTVFLPPPLKRPSSMWDSAVGSFASNVPQPKFPVGEAAAGGRSVCSFTRRLNRNNTHTHTHTHKEKKEPWTLPCGRLRVLPKSPRLKSPRRGANPTAILATKRQKKKKMKRKEWKAHLCNIQKTDFVLGPDSINGDPFPPPSNKEWPQSYPGSMDLFLVFSSEHFAPFESSAASRGALMKAQPL